MFMIIQNCLHIEIPSIIPNAYTPISHIKKQDPMQSAMNNPHIFNNRHVAQKPLLANNPTIYTVKSLKKEPNVQQTQANSATNTVNSSQAPQRKYQCNYCNKQYKHLCNLKSHQKVHTDEALICPHCKKRFGRKANYKEHLRIHTGETPYQCKFCQRKFKHHHR